MVGTLSSHHAMRPGEKLHIEMEKHRRPVASLEMSCSHPFLEPGRGARPYMDPAGGALSPENVGYRVKAKTHGRACPRNTTAPRNRLLRGTAPSGRRSGLGRGWGLNCLRDPAAGLRACTALCLRRPGFSWTKSGRFVFVCSRLNDHILGAGSAAGSVPRASQQPQSSCDSP